MNEKFSHFNRCDKIFFNFIHFSELWFNQNLIQFSLTIRSKNYL